MAGYGDDSGFSTWLSANGYELPVGAPTAAVLRQRGSVYIDGTYVTKFSGTPANGAAQEREWPRTSATDRYGNALASDSVPTRVVEASYMAAYLEASSPGSLAASGSASAAVKRERVEGAVEVEYQASTKAWAAEDLVPKFTAIEAILAPLLSPVVPGVLVV